jgi:hypothetical protein
MSRIILYLCFALTNLIAVSAAAETANAIAKNVSGIESPMSIMVAASFGTAEDCIHPEATCIPNGFVVINYTVSGTGNCSFTANIIWGDGSSESHTYTSNITFQHQYASPNLYMVSVTGSGEPLDQNSTCTFTPFANTYEVPSPKFPVLEYTQSALDMLAALTEKVGEDWAKVFATFWTQLQSALNIFNFSKDLSEFKNYNDYALAKADSFYQTPTGKGNLDEMANLFYSKDYGSLNKGERLNVAKALANQTGATGFLINQARKASKTGTGIIFQNP